jgi:DnaK suppressor protein
MKAATEATKTTATNDQGKREGNNDNEPRTQQRRHGLTKTQLATLGAELERLRGEVRERLDRRRRSIREQGGGAGGDEGDQALDSTNRELAARLINRDANLLTEIDHARAKLDDGRYGLCERSGEPIGYDRLKLRPWTRFAGAAKEIVDREKRAARGGGVIVNPEDNGEEAA